MQRASTAVLVLLLGATLTTGPAAAQRAETVRIGAGAAATDAFVVYPISKSAAAVIVTHDWWGLNDQVRTVARRLAGEGYVAIVPDLFHGRVTDDAEEAHALMQGIPTDRANADLDATVAWLRANPRVGNRPIGLHSSALSGIVVFDGPPETDPVQLGALHSPVMAHFGAKNNGIPETRVAAFRDAGRNAEVYVYPAAARGFMNDARPSYQPDAARQAWARTLTFLQKQLRDSK
jgi:carboxymethylenebutenolidase